jgi:hypothetical protein
MDNQILVPLYEKEYESAWVWIISTLSWIELLSTNSGRGEVLLTKKGFQTNNLSVNL